MCSPTPFPKTNAHLNFRPTRTSPTRRDHSWSAGRSSVPLAVAAVR
jgi:hypothetical protein